MKKIALALAVVLSISIAPPAYAGIGVMIDGTYVRFTESTGSPVIDGGRTLVPLRVAMEAYGCRVSWSETFKKATVEKNGTRVEIPVGHSYIYVDGRLVMNDTSAKIIDGRVYLPIRAVLEALGADVSWDESKKSVAVTSDDKKKEQEEKQRAYEERQKEIAEINRQIEEDIKKRQEESKKRQEEMIKERERLDAEYDRLMATMDEIRQNALSGSNKKPSAYDSIANTGGYGNSYAYSQGFTGDLSGGYGSTYADIARQQYLDNLLVQNRYK